MASILVNEQSGRNVVESKPILFSIAALLTAASALTSGAAPVVIGWGRKDRLCLPQQANRAIKAFPDATLHWFEHSGHFPMWDQPEETVRVILDATGVSGSK